MKYRRHCVIYLLIATLIAHSAFAETRYSKALVAHDHAVVQAMLRIDGAKAADYPQHVEAIGRYLDDLAERQPKRYLETMQSLKATPKQVTLQRLALSKESGQHTVEAGKWLVEQGLQQVIIDGLQMAIDGKDFEHASSLAARIGSIGGDWVVEPLREIMLNDDNVKSVRSAAASALANGWHGQQTLLAMAKANEVPAAVMFEVRNGLIGAWDKKTVAEAKKIPSLKQSEEQAMPTVKELVARMRQNSDPDRGRGVFKTKGTCNKCHQVAGEGLNVGPDLSEIGSKLSREDMFVAILNPSAGISHNYETYACLTEDGTIVTGLLIGETEDEITIKSADATEHKIDQEAVLELKRQEVSLMPENLHQNLSTQELVDLVDYLTLLKKPEEARFNAATANATDVDRSPKAAIDGFEIGDGLSIQLSASEPTMLSPSSIDVDHLGRVWVCEIVNYRHFRNHNNDPRDEGDRILVMEDTDEDGRMDKTTVFYQGTDIDSPHGVCVLGDRVIVSAGENVVMFRDTDGDLVPEEKKLMFTGIGGVQHDHGIHSFMPGPDGKLYFNFGNEGKQLLDAEGKPVVDLAGNVVNDTRQPYQQGMVFRCDLDGSNVETLGWNFRNNWEVAVDSFGAMWQSDNDDDGNRGTRINFVMPYGNYGYRNEKTGNYWQAERIGMRESIGQRHWHLNDPGVVPNLLQTGAGSPTGIMIYEGKLLPQQFHGQMIHTDPGPNVVRAYPVEIDGAGYKASIDNLIKGVADQWFRPVDVCTAPDGSVFVADWYDPGVGGHRMGDTRMGRLFRMTTAESEAYRVDKPSFETIDNALDALTNPNQSTRFLAGEALKAFWTQDVPNVPSLLDPSDVSDPVQRARRMWILAAIDATRDEAIQLGLADSDLNVRLAAIRSARQHASVDDVALVNSLANDPSPQVRRELAISLRGHNTPQAIAAWSKLAALHDGQDRWYLEALGIAADGKWDACLEAYLALDSTRDDAKSDIIWRSRGKSSPNLIVDEIIASENVADQERYFRALEFFQADERAAALEQILQAS
ncbi:MAG: PVC-type heme-binding CxxCH protein [Planctomycetota bacterium]